MLRRTLAMPLRLRLALLFGVASGLVVAFTGYLLFVQVRSDLEASVGSTLQARSDALTARLAGGGAPDRLVGGATEVAEVLAADGRVLAGSPSTGGEPLVSGAELTAARLRSVTVVTDVRGVRTRVLAAPVRRGRTVDVAAVGVPSDIAERAENRIKVRLLLVGPPAALVGGAAAWLLAAAALRPVERMRRQVADIGTARTDARIAVPETRDEIAALARTMNELLGRLQGALARQRAFVADAGHELRTPLTILTTELELAARPDRSRDELVEAVGFAVEDTHRLARLAEDLLLLASADTGPDFLRPVPFSLTGDVLIAAVRGAGARGAARDVAVLLDAPDPLELVGDADRLRQAVDNVLANAVRVAPTGTDVLVTGRRTGDRVVVEVRDHGPGFPDEFLPQAFERFRRADRARDRQAGGAGLGLAIVRSLVIAHGGRATASNHPDGGAVVCLELPVACAR